MSLYLNGTEILGSLIVDGNTGGKELPQVVFAESKNKSSIRTTTYTFTEDGKFQFYVFERSDNTITPATQALIKLNGNDVSRTVNDTRLTDNWYYGEIEVSAGDVFTVTNTVTETNRGFQTFLFKNTDISKFNIIGFEGNNNNTFPLTLSDAVYLQSYMSSYYSGANRFSYDVGIYAPESVPTPSGTSTYFYGCTWAIQIA